MTKVVEQKIPPPNEQLKKDEQIRRKFTNFLRESGERIEKQPSRGILKRVLSKASGGSAGAYYLKELEIDKVGKVKIWSSSTSLKEASVYISFPGSRADIPYAGEVSQLARNVGFDGTYGSIHFGIDPRSGVEMTIGSMSRHDFDKPPFVKPDSLGEWVYGRVPVTEGMIEDLDRIANLCIQ